MRTVVVSHVYGQTPRHLAARANWPTNVIGKTNWGRNAQSIGNDRPLPFLRDLLQAGLDSGADVIVTVNDDCSFVDGALEKMARHCEVFEYGCVRRDPKHCGRESFFFLASWLREHLAEMPDVVICIDRWDLVIARWLRSFRGFKTTDENLIDDLFPVEVEPPLIHHQDHKSWWTEATQSPASKHNAALWEAKQ